MARFNKSTNSEPITLGKVGAFEVKAVKEGAPACLIIGRTWLSAGKIKTVLANSDTCKVFLAQFDSQQAHNEVARLEAQLAKAKAEATRRTSPPPLDSLNRTVEKFAGGGRFNAESAQPEAPAPAQP